jgi:hypothetical protein
MKTWTYSDACGVDNLFFEGEINLKNIIDFIKNNSSVCESTLNEITNDCITYCLDHNIRSLQDKTGKLFPYCHLNHLFDFTQDISLSEIHPQICFPTYNLAVTFKNK